MTTKKPYGLWDSPLTPSSMAGDLGLNDVGWAGDGQTLVWLESRGGDRVIVAERPGEASRDLTREESVGGGVGYGGGEFSVHGQTVYFARSDGRLARMSIDEGPSEPITPEFGGVASPTISPDGQWALYVHHEDDTDVIAATRTDGSQWPQKVVRGADFYMQPTWHPSGDKIAWVEWDHPNMPWDATRLLMADVAVEGGHLTVGEPEQVAGRLGERGERIAAMQPSFSPDGERLAYISDDDGWWHLHVRNLETGRTTQLTEGNVEMGGPAWVQGQRFFEWSPDGRELVARRNQRGKMDLLRVGLDGSVTEIDAVDRYDTIMQPAVSQTGRVAFVGSAPDQPGRIVSWADGESPTVRRRSADERIESDAFSQVRDVSWEAPDGQEVHGQYYPPTNPDFESTGKPPAIIMVHGGPTSQRTAAFEERSQFFATRGFAVVDVNYRGSTGYGRDYREALLGDWGVKDVQDVVSAREWLGDEGLADPDRCVVMGGSAGGYTVLRTLVTHPGTFAAGISMYGISNLFELALDTHKFEARYTDRLVGQLPDDSDIYRERSPLFHADAIEDPVAVFQGGEDKVVPQAQAEAIVESLASRGVPHEYHLYDEEGHGWRQPETVEHFYGACMEFLKKHVIFG